MLLARRKRALKRRRSSKTSSEGSPPAKKAKSSLHANWTKAATQYAFEIYDYYLQVKAPKAYAKVAESLEKNDSSWKYTNEQVRTHLRFSEPPMVLGGTLIPVLCIVTHL